jgi:hypothetical protein
MSYSPNNPRYLTIADSMTSNGEANARLILDTVTNIFYTLDDDGNFLPIQANEWTETTIDISSDEILNMGSNPIVLLPAAGEGKYFDYESIKLEYIHNTTAYTLSEKLYISDFVQTQISELLITAGGDVVSVIRAFYSDTFVDTDVYSFNQVKPLNQDLILSTWNGTNPEDGNGTMKVKIKYKIVDFG